MTIDYDAFRDTDVQPNHYWGKEAMMPESNHISETFVGKVLMHELGKLLPVFQRLRRRHWVPFIKKDAVKKRIFVPKINTYEALCWQVPGRDDLYVDQWGNLVRVTTLNQNFWIDPERLSLEEAQELAIDLHVMHKQLVGK